MTDPDEELQASVEAALRTVKDPTLDMDVFEAGLIEDVRINDGHVTIEADLTDFGTDGTEQAMAAMMDATADVPGVERAHVEHATPDLTDRSAGVGSVDRIIAVASVKGGVGKTTVATNLACALATDEAIGLFDADIHGPNVPSLLGVSGPVYSDDEGNPLPVETSGLEVMSVGLMEEGAPLAWRGAMAHDALTELFEETAWQDRETLVIDLPPGTGDVVLTTLQEVPVDGVVFVTTPFHAAVTDTERSIELFRENDVPVLGVVVNMGQFSCPSCGDTHDLFPGGTPLEGIDVPILAELPFTPALQDPPRPGMTIESIDAMATQVRRRFEEIWNPTLPDEALDLRGVPSEDRHEQVETAFRARESGESFTLISDRDPSPVRSYLVELADLDDPNAFPELRIRQVNPETWVLETERP